jgi:hypothetical protein
MLLSRILLTGLALACVMFVIRDGRLLRSAGLTGSCRVVLTAPDGTRFETCRGGELGGAPRLDGRGCLDLGLLAGRPYWRCPPGQ